MRFLAIWMGMGCVATADWPTYLGDGSRSGIARSKLALPLRESWAHRSPHKPRPAWRGPARNDLYNKQMGLHNRQAFDHAYHVVTVGGLVFYGSSADDQLYCLDKATGIVKWTFFAEGPIRLAPTIHNNRVWFGSDDGFVYCISLAGKLIWKKRLGPRDYRVPGNGRMISAWPVRSGVLVSGGLVFAAAGMFPSEGVYVCALGTATGEIKWRTLQTDLTAQGYLLMSQTQLFVAAGRASPVVYDLATGKRLRAVGGQGGTDVTLAGDDLVVGPGRTGQLCLIPAGQEKVFATFSGTRMVVTQDLFLIHGVNEMRAINRPEFLKWEGRRKQITASVSKLEGHIKNVRRGKPGPKPLSDLSVDLAEAKEGLASARIKLAECETWKQPGGYPYALILSGEHVFVGGQNEVAARNLADGEIVWRQSVKGRALGLAISNERLLVSTNLGTIYCFKSEAKQ